MFIQIDPPIMLIPPPVTAEKRSRQKIPSFDARLGNPDAPMAMAEMMAATEMTVPVLANSLNHSIPPKR
jgi:hypothetical protein